MSNPTKQQNNMRDVGSGPPAGGTASEGDDSNMQGRPTWSPQGSGPVSDSTSGPEATSSQGLLTSNLKTLWVKPDDLHGHSPDCRASGCIDVVAQGEYDRLRAALQEVMQHGCCECLECVIRIRKLLSGDSSALETATELERLRELQEAALALDDAVAEFGIDKPEYIAEVYQKFHDALHDGQGSPSAVETEARYCEKCGERTDTYPDGSYHKCAANGS